MREGLSAIEEFVPLGRTQRAIPFCGQLMVSTEAQEPSLATVHNTVITEYTTKATMDDKGHFDSVNDENNTFDQAQD